MSQPKDWDNVFAVNVTANWQLIRCMDPLLQRAEAGRAVFLTSGVAHYGRAYWGPYAASKAALEALVRTYAAETESVNVRANLFSPGPARTRMYAAAFPGIDPMTLPTPEEVSQAIVPLVPAGMHRDRQALRLSRGQVSGVPGAGVVDRSSPRKRGPSSFWIPAFAGMSGILNAGASPCP